MKPLEKEIKQKNDKNLYRNNKSGSIKVTAEDNYVQILEKNNVTEKKN